MSPKTYRTPHPLCIRCSHRTADPGSCNIDTASSLCGSTRPGCSHRRLRRRYRTAHRHSGMERNPSLLTYRPRPRNTTRLRQCLVYRRLVRRRSFRGLLSDRHPDHRTCRPHCNHRGISHPAHTRCQGQCRLQSGHRYRPFRTPSSRSCTLRKRRGTRLHNRRHRHNSRSHTLQTLRTVRRWALALPHLRRRRCRRLA